MSLPVVKLEVFETVMAQYLNDSRYNQNLWTRMVTDNPEVFIYIQKMRELICEMHGEDAAKGAENCAAVLFKALENQDELNQLEALIGG